MHDEKAVPLAPKAFDLLVVLVENHGRTVTKVQLMDLLWPEMAVEENNLTVNVSALRKALGGRGRQHQYIQTVSRGGYRFVEQVSEIAVAVAAADGGPTAAGSGGPTPLDADAFVATETVQRIREFNRIASIQRLVEHSTGPAHTPLPETEPFGGCQREIHDTLASVLRTHPGLRWVVTGPPGVGKSTVLRALALLLAEQFQRGKAEQPLPILIPLHQITLPAKSAGQASTEEIGHRGEALFGALLARWCTWAEGAQPAKIITPEYVLFRLANRPSVVLLDGVDEFLTNNPSFGIGEIRDLLTYLNVVLAGGGHLSIVLGVRNSLPAFRTLASGIRNTFEIKRLSQNQATRWFPETAQLLAAVTDPEVRGLILTPLVLRWIGPRVGRLPAAATFAVTPLLDAALHAIVEESRLVDLRVASGAAYEYDDWLGALQVIAWIFFAGFKGSASLAELESEIRVMVARWERTRESSLPVPEGAIAILMDPTASTALLQRTIFYPTGRGTYRFMHRLWQDFLASCYFADCMRVHQIDELGHVGLSPAMFRRAGEWLDMQQFRVDHVFVSRLLERGRAIGKGLIIANSIAMLANSSVSMDGPAIEATLAAYADATPLTRLIILNGLGYRALRNDDPTASDLRRLLVLLYQDCLAGRHPFAHGGATMRAIAWCYLKAFSFHFKTLPPACEFPGWDASAEAENAELEVICTRTPKGTSISIVNRSVQLAFLEAQRLLPTDPSRPISVVHYLYYLVLARKHGAHISEVSSELPLILDPERPNGSTILAYAPVPELAVLFQRCRAINELAIGPPVPNQLPSAPDA
jgi:DNA-binding winged helix-turn-helix (wHTH) protein/energy-coupling factor transporter ATP-binding protein EcfA2